MAENWGGVGSEENGAIMLQVIWSIRKGWMVIISSLFIKGMAREQVTNPGKDINGIKLNNL